MQAPRVFISMICALLVFAVATYFIHGSVYTAFIQTLICLVIIQVGYFIGVVYLVSREKKRMRKTLEFQKEMPAANEPSVAENMSAVTRHRPKLTDI
ncbi:exopolysaccharide production repressor protein [uncultured Agrobacterium sp.]|uniref:exopolysaccharide production repressor protein n=1 Tax=uncultured Agrobacterium sp. TaxID=157277 RepID=UPI00338DBCDC